MLFTEPGVANSRQLTRRVAITTLNFLKSSIMNALVNVA